MRPRSNVVVCFFLFISIWLAPASRSQISVFPYSQNFDSVTVPNLPLGWSSTQNRSQGTNDFTTTTSTPRTSPNAVVSTNATIGQALISPLFDLGGQIPDRLVFYTRRSATHLARVVVEASLDSGGTFPIQIGDSLTYLGSTNYVLTSFVLPTSLSNRTGVQFRWRVVPDIGGPTGTFRIDDVMLTVQTTYDLAMSGLRFSPPIVNEQEIVHAIALVRNVGLQAAQSFEVRFYCDLNGDSLPQAIELIAAVTNPSPILPGDSIEVPGNLGTYFPGSRTFIAEVAYSLDQNPTNNQVHRLLWIGYRPRSVVVNEIMYAPTGTEPEWVELFNTRTDTVNVKDWLVSDINIASKKLISSSRVNIPPLGFLLVTKDSAALLDIHPAISSRVVNVPTFPTLNNTGDAVVLYDNRAATMDSVSYLPAWGGSGGTSLERLDVFEASNDSSNWVSSTSSTHATPGRENSVAVADNDLRALKNDSLIVAPGVPVTLSVTVKNVGRMPCSNFDVAFFDDVNRDSIAAPGELISRVHVPQSILRGDTLRVSAQWANPSPGVQCLIARIEYVLDERPANNATIFAVKVGYEPLVVVVNEIMYAPFTGEAEYAELKNTSSTEIDLTGWKLSDRPGATGSANTFQLTNHGRRLRPGECFLIASDSSIFSRFHYLDTMQVGLLTIANQSSLGFNNEGDAVIIRDATLRAIDSVAYSPGWHNPAVTDATGRSLERIRPNLGSNDARNWSTCVSGVGGTPGITNSIFTTTLPANANISCSPNPFSPDGDGREDFSVIHCELPTEVATISLRIYDVKGRLIRHLVNNEPCGVQRDVVWNGYDEEGQKARMGIYIVLLEGLNENGGSVYSAKGVVVLASKL